MTARQSFNRARRLDLDEASIALWVFRRQPGSEVKFTANFVPTTAALQARLKLLADQWLDRHTELQDYSLLAQNNPIELLTVPVVDTQFPVLAEKLDEVPTEHVFNDVAQLSNCTGYAVRLHVGGRRLYLIRKAPSNWYTKRSISVTTAIVVARRLDLAEDRAFNIASTFDFAVFDDFLFVENKSAFESVLSYKAEYVDAFASLKQDRHFTAVFADLAPLNDHVGTNTMHLRRMATIQEKGFYRDPAYLGRLRALNNVRQWNIQFDAQGRIVPTEGTIKTIIRERPALPPCLTSIGA
jgi:Domain of unknown function (DUF4868)